MGTEDQKPARRATDRHFSKRFIIVPVVLFAITVALFTGLKTSDKKVTATETTTASVTEFSAPTSPATASSPKTVSDVGVKPSLDPKATGAEERPRFRMSLEVMKERESYRAQQRQWYAQISFSLLFTLASLYIILSKKYPEDVNKWGYSTIAFVMGYWLKSL